MSVSSSSSSHHTASSSTSSSKYASIPQLPRYKSVDSQTGFAVPRADEQSPPPHYPPRQSSDAHVLDFEEEKKRKDSVWSISYQSDFGGEDEEDRGRRMSPRQLADDELSDSGDDSESLLSKRFIGAVDETRGESWIRRKKSKSEAEDDWTVGGRKRRAIILLIGSLIILVLLLLGTSYRMVKKYHHDSIVLLSPKDIEVVDLATNEIDEAGQVPPLDPEPDRYVRPSQATLRTAVGDNPKFFAMDGNFTASFHEQRVGIETLLNLASVSKRIPVISDHVWVRTCRVTDDECSKYTLDYSRDRSDEEFEIADGSDLFLGGYAGWKVGIEHFIDIPHLRKSYGMVLTLSEYFTLFNDSLSASDMNALGRWNTKTYTPANFTSSEIILSEWFNEREFTRIDVDLPIWSPIDSKAEIIGLNPVKARDLQEQRSSRAWTLELARETLVNNGYAVTGDDQWLEEALEKVGQAKVYTFDASVANVKTASRPIFEMVDRSRAFSFESEFLTQPRHRDASILYLSGQFAHDSKLGGLRFSTAERRDKFKEIVESSLRPPIEYREVGKMIAETMSSVATKGRKWLAAEMKKEDYEGMPDGPTTPFWAKARIARTVRLLGAGTAALRSHEVDNPPHAGDFFFLSTDETDKKSLHFYRKQGAALLTDLLGGKELSLLGWRGLFVDLLNLVEVEVMAASDYFLGSRTSRLTGQIVDFREGPRFGKSDWSWGLN